MIKAKLKTIPNISYIDSKRITSIDIWNTYYRYD